jgi:hypothetical protein
VISVSEDRLTVHKNIYPASSASGTLQVQGVAWPAVSLASSTGQTLVFDAGTQAFR